MSAHAQGNEGRIVQVRDAAASDAAALADLAEQLGYPCTPEDMASRLPGTGESAHERVIVAEDRVGGVVGWITVRETVHIHSAPYADVSGFVVDQAFRGRGIGKLLMAEVERWSRARGLGAIRLSTNIKRTEAHRFYESLGFRIIKTQYALKKDLVDAPPHPGA